MAGLESDPRDHSPSDCLVPRKGHASRRTQYKEGDESCSVILATSFQAEIVCHELMPRRGSRTHEQCYEAEATPYVSAVLINTSASRLQLAHQEMPVTWFKKHLAVRLCNLCFKGEGPFTHSSLSVMILLGSEAKKALS